MALEGPDMDDNELAIRQYDADDDYAVIWATDEFGKWPIGRSIGPHLV